MPVRYSAHVSGRLIITYRTKK